MYVLSKDRSSLRVSIHDVDLCKYTDSTSDTKN